MIQATQIALLVGLVATAPPPEAPRGDAVFLPGHEEAVAGLLLPDDVDSFRCGDWTLDALVPGPDCAVHVRMIGPDGAVTEVRFGVGLEASVTRGPREVLACLEDRFSGNAGPDFFDDKCVFAEEASRVEARGSGGGVRLAVLGLGALLAVGFLGWKGERSEGTPLTGWLSLAAWVAPALALRAWLMQTLPPGAYELENFGAGTPFAELTLQTGALRGWLDPVSPAFHPPLVRTFLDPWLMLGDALGVGGSLWWLRLPNLGLTVLALVLLVRLGRLLGSPTAGRLAAVLFAWLPATILITVFQGHYAWEMVLCLWFMERLSTWVIDGRSTFVSLPLVGALALWTGHLAALVVAPGFLLFLVTSLRRNRRTEAFAATLLLLALYLPIAESAVLGASGYTAASIQSPLSPDEAGTAASVGHSDLPMTTPSLWDAVALPIQLPVRLFGGVGAVIALAGMGLLHRRRRLMTAAGVLLILYVLVQARLSTRWENLSALFPLVILGAALGLERLKECGLRFATRVPWVAVFITVSLIGGGWGAWRHADGAGITEVVGRVGHDDSEVGLAARMMGDELEDLPVLLLAPADRYPYHLCPDRSTVAGVQTCILAAEGATGRGRVRRYVLGDRDIVATEIASEDGDGCMDLEEILGSPPFLGTYIAVLSWDSALVSEESPCEQRFQMEGCEVLSRSPGLRLVRCE